LDFLGTLLFCLFSFSLFFGFFGFDYIVYFIFLRFRFSFWIVGLILSFSECSFLKQNTSWNLWYSFERIATFRSSPVRSSLWLFKGDGHHMSLPWIEVNIQMMLIQWDGISVGFSGPWNGGTVYTIWLFVPYPWKITFFNR
jgi:hypothetical protein